MIYRRVDDDFLDPLCFRPDSMLGVAGLMNAYRAGNVALANAVGTGVADDKAIYPFVPRHDPLLPRARSRSCRTSRPTSAPRTPDRKYVLANLRQAGGQGGQRVGRLRHADGPPGLDQAEREEFAEKIEANPRDYIAQPIDRAEPAPEPRRRHSSKAGASTCGRTSSTARRSIVMPGGLTRVALRRGSLVVNSSQGGGSKDTWVLEEDTPGVPEPLVRRPTPTRPPTWLAQARRRRADRPLITLNV